MESFEDNSNINPARRDLIRSLSTQQPPSPSRKRPYTDDWDAEAQRRLPKEHRVKATVRNRSWFNPELKRKGFMDSHFSNKKSRVDTQLVSPLNNNCSPARSSVSSHEENLFLTQSPGEIIHSAAFSPPDTHNNNTTTHSNGLHHPELKRLEGSPQSDTAMRRSSPPRDPRLARRPSQQEPSRADGANGIDHYQPRPRSPTASRSSRNGSPGSLRRSSTSTPRISEKRKRSSPPPRRSPPPPPRRSATTATADHIGRYIDQLATSIGQLSKQEIDLETKKDVEHKHQSEVEKLRKVGGYFMSMSERQKEHARKLKWHTTRLNQKLAEHQNVKEGAVQGIAASLLAASHGGLRTDHEDKDERISAVEKELSLFKEQRDDAQASLRKVQTEMKSLDCSITDIKNRSEQLGTLKAESADLKSRLSSAECNIADIRLPQAPHSEIVALSNRLSKAEQDTANIGGLDADVKVVQDQLKQMAKGAKVDTLAVEIKDIKVEATKVMDRAAEQKKLVLSLKEVIFEDEKGLVDIVSNADRNVDNFRETIKAYSRELDEFQRDLTTHNDRLTTLEASNHPISTSSNLAHTTLTSSNLAHSTSLQANGSSLTMDRIIQLEATVSGIKRDLTQLATDQEAKDELIGDENDNIHSEINTLKANYTTQKIVLDNMEMELKALREDTEHREAEFQKLVNEVEALKKVVKEHSDKMALLENKQKAVEHFTIVLNQQVGTISSGAAKVEELKVLVANLSTDLSKLVKDLSTKVRNLSTKVDDSMTDSGGVQLPNEVNTDIDAIKKELAALNDVVTVIKGHKTVNLKKLKNQVSHLQKFLDVFFNEINKNHLPDIYQKVQELCLKIGWEGFKVRPPQGNQAVDDKVEEEGDEAFFLFPETEEVESHEA